MQKEVKKYVIVPQQTRIHLKNFFIEYKKKLEELLIQQQRLNEELDNCKKEQTEHQERLQSLEGGSSEIDSKFYLHEQRMKELENQQKETTQKLVEVEHKMVEFQDSMRREYINH